jgi:hypothetical protein
MTPMDGAVTESALSRCGHRPLRKVGSTNIYRKLGYLPRSSSAFGTCPEGEGILSNLLPVIPSYSDFGIPPLHGIVFVALYQIKVLKHQ